MSFKEGILMSYVIDAAKCTGCGDCVAACPVEAVCIDDRNHFSIDPDVCTDCGTCADICPENAVRGS
jgi:ferredoxin